MDITKNISHHKINPEGYCTDVNNVDTLSDDENVLFENGDNLTSYESNFPDAYRPQPGGPFSALTQSMWPQDIIYALTKSEDSYNHGIQLGLYDEFGFRIAEFDSSDEQSSNGDSSSIKTNHQPEIVSTVLEDSESHRLKWVAHLEFNIDGGLDSDLSWQQVTARLPHSEKLSLLVKEGIPSSLRAPIWMRLSGATGKKATSSTSYKDIVKASSVDSLVTSKQIEKDLLRTMPSHACFSHISSTGVPRLRRVLRGLAWLYSDIGYCQGMGVIVANLLLILEEEDTFWMMCAIIEDLLPASYYSSTLLGVQADQRVLKELITLYLSDIDNILKEHDIELSLISLHWFLTIFASVVHVKALVRIWDLFFCEGSILLFRITLAILKMKEKQLLQVDNSAQIFNWLSDGPSEITDVEELIRLAYEVGGDLTIEDIDIRRRRHLAILMADEGALVNPDASRNLPKQHLNKRQLKQSRSLISLWLWGDDTEKDSRAKNIKQTEMLVDLRNAVLQIVRHFQSLDPKNSKVNTQPDYSLESHAKDLENYVQVARNRRRRAKALLDFERHDDDELGFRKNDIITILSMRDEHCWIGELNGLRGWFPAKFVELLDERSKNYSVAGDDSINESITDLVRGVLCPALRTILEHGLKRASILDTACHPWLFIEEAATHEVEKDFNTVYSRLVLCKTFRLDEDGKVLTPEEILYKAVQSVNLTHDAAHAQMDVKFRSLICYGLNEQVLHLWLETLCSCVEVVNKWYHPWSFMRSPGWVQIKCELRILSQFALNLSQDWELPSGQSPLSPHQIAAALNLREGVREMLIKHHLFSWEL